MDMPVSFLRLLEGMKFGYVERKINDSLGRSGIARRPPADLLLKRFLSEQVSATFVSLSFHVGTAPQNKLLQADPLGH